MGWGWRVDLSDDCFIPASKELVRLLFGMVLVLIVSCHYGSEPLDSGENWVAWSVLLDRAFLRHGWYVDSSGKARRNCHAYTIPYRLS
jgi:hypothetical protein